MDIPLGKALYAIELEELLRSYYARSLRATDGVVFRAQGLERIGILQAGMLVLWIRRLAAKKRDVSVDTEARLGNHQHNVILSRLHRWRFFQALDLTRARVDATPGTQGSQAPSPSQNALIGLHFFSGRDSLNKLLHTLDAQQQELFGNAASLPFISNGALRNIIFRELSDNVFTHAKNISGFTAMVKHQPFPSALVNSLPAWEQGFFRRVSGEYLEVVVGDHGPSIPRTLKERWSEDREHQRRHEDTDTDVLEYAFGKYVRRRVTPDQYLQQLLDRAEHGTAIDPSGLYFVQQVASEQGALLSVRSGHAWLAWDYSQGPDASAASNALDKRTQRCAKFGGAQYRLLFPLGPRPVESRASVYLERASVRDYPLKKVQFVPWQGDECLPEVENEVLSRCVEDLRNRIVAASDETLTIVDSIGALRSKRHAAVLLLACVHFQSPSKPIAVLAMDDERELIRHAAKASDGQHAPGDLPLLMISADLTLSLINATERESLLFASALSGTARVNLGDHTLTSMRHLIRADAITSELHVRVSEEGLRRALLDHLRLTMESWRVAPPRGIRATGRFLLPPPSSVYCDAFWDINQIVDIPKRLTIAAAAVALLILETQPTFVAALSRSAACVAQEALKLVKHRMKRGVEFGKVPDLDTGAGLASLSARARHERSVLVTDVIGTARTMETVLQVLGPQRVECLICIVDARPQDANDHILSFHGVVPVRSLVRSPNRYHDGLPPGWSYASVQVIDAVAHRPQRRIEDQTEQEPGLSAKSSTVLESDMFECGHFVAGSRHLSTFILTSRLLEQSRDVIVGWMLDRLRRASEGLQPNEKIELTHLMHTSHSEAARRAIVTLQDTFPEAVPDSVDIDSLRMRGMFAAPKAEDKPVRDVVILEPGASSGETARALLAYAAMRGARRAFVFIVVDRMNELDTWALSKTTTIGDTRVDVARFVSLKSPAYELGECPQCRLLTEYEYLRMWAGDQNANRQLTWRVEQMAPRPIAIYRDLRASPNLITAVLRKAEVNAQCDYHAARDIEERHRLASSVPAVHAADEVCCGLLLAFAREAPLFRPRGRLSDLAYPTFRHRMRDCALAHLLPDAMVSNEVLSAASLVVAELWSRENNKGDRPWWRERLSQSAVEECLLEYARTIASCPLGEVDPSLLSSEVAEIERAIEDNGWASGTTAAWIDAARDLGRVRAPVDGDIAAGDSPASAWQVLWDALKPHRPLAQGLDALEAILTPNQSAASLKVFYNVSWKDRVEAPMVGVVLPALRRIKQLCLSAMPDPLCPVSEGDIQRLATTTTEVSAGFADLVRDAGTPDTRADKIEALRLSVRAIASMLKGETARVKHLLSSLVTAREDDIRVHARAIVEELQDIECECELNLVGLTSGNAAFVRASDLVTCIEAVCSNVKRHAFPDDFRGHRIARITSSSGDGQYTIRVEDSGVGLPDVVPENIDGRERGIASVRRFVGIYGGGISVGVSPLGGCLVEFRWRAVSM